VSSLSDELRQEYTIETPENVSFGYDVAGIGSRFIGALIDLFLVFILLLLLNIATWTLVIWTGGEAVLFLGLEADAGWIPGLIIAFYALFEFAIIWGYFFSFELLWNGQTPGKRVTGTRAVRMDGEPAGFSEVAIRNLVRFVDFMPTAYAIGFVTMLFNEKSRRLGDFAAGTLVVRERTALALSDLAPAPREPGAPVGASDANFRIISHEDIALIHDALDREAKGRLNPSTLIRLAAVYAARLEKPPPPATLQDAREFLSQLASAWEQRSTPSATSAT
jgi:uncharacterized RDD family membrane protein YckC